MGYIFTKFDEIFIHELGHSFGALHAAKIRCIDKLCENNRLTRGPIIIKYGLMEKFTDIGIAGKLIIGKSEYEYYRDGNSFDIMSYYTDYPPRQGYDFNAATKHLFKWSVGNGKMIVINQNKPQGRYLIKRYDQEGAVVLGFTFGSTNNDKNAVDYYLEYRNTKPDLNNKERGLAINITKPFVFGEETFLLSGNNHNEPVEKVINSFTSGDSLVDEDNKIKIYIQKLDVEEKIAVVNVCQLDEEESFNLIPILAGNIKISSTNIFENDLLGENNTTKSITIKENFLIENTSLCFNKKYTIDQSSIIINQNNLYLSTSQFNLVSTEEIPPSQSVNNFFTTTATVNNPVLPDSQLEFQVVEQNLDKDKDPQNKTKQTISKKLVYQFHVVPSTEEYRNDLEPHMIDIEDQNTNNKEFNHLETEKGQTLIFTSNIANNSRNPDGNKSIEFFVKWEIQDEKGNNVIPPFRQRHDGIPPKTLDNANPATLTWIIPQDLKAGDYKIILEVDSNNRLQEFNENNNMIWRYFNVVE